jgi:predicted Zn-dependent protease
VIAALREKKPAEAKRLLSELVREFPQNSMFRSELQKLG